MPEWFAQSFPNVVSLWPEFLKAMGETLIMLLWSGAIASVLGLILGLALTVTRKDGILKNLPLHKGLGFLINFFRSIPFIILLTWVMPVSRFLMGSAINLQGAIVPLIFGTVPFFCRQVESALAQVSPGLIEAAESMGDSPWQIIVRVYLKESIGPLARALTITTVSLLGLTAMAGAVGAGGLGDFAIRYGHDRNMQDITWLVVITVALMVCVIELAGHYVIKKNTFE